MKVVGGVEVVGGDGVVAIVRVIVQVMVVKKPVI